MTINKKQCSVCGSINEVYNRTINGEKMLLCNLHWCRFRMNGTFLTKTDVRRETKNKSKCKICGVSGKDTYLTETTLNGEKEYYCRHHYQKLVYYGDAEHRTIFTKNEIIEHENYLEILLYDKNNNYTKSVFASKEHKDLISQYKWRLEKSYNTFYASSYINIDGRESTIKMHQVICNNLFGKIPEGYTVDHIDRNGLNNLNENLRYATNSEQQHNKSMPKNNTSGVKGVYYNKNKNLWVAKMSFNKQKKSKSFKDFEKAVNKRMYWDSLIENNQIEEIIKELKS
jgi:hypothetical protein